jgi:hypothetical protein
VRAGLRAVSDRLAVPRDRGADHERRGLFVAQGHRARLVAAAQVELAEVGEAKELAKLIGLRPRRDDRVRDPRLPVTRVIALRALREQALVDADRVRPLAGVEVELREALIRLEGRFFTRGDAAEECERLVRRPGARIRQHELAPRLPRDVRDVAQIGMRRCELDRAHEVIERAAEVLDVVERPRRLVEGVRVERVALGRELEHAPVEAERVVERAFVERALREREKRVRHEPAPGVIAHEPRVHAARAVALSDRLEHACERVEDLVRAAVGRVVADEPGVGADHLLADLLEPRLGARLLRRERAHPVPVAPPARSVDRLVEAADRLLHELLQLEERLGDAHEHVGPARVVAADVDDEPAQHVELAQEERLGARDPGMIDDLHHVRGSALFGPRLVTAIDRGRRTATPGSRRALESARTLVELRLHGLRNAPRPLCERVRMQQPHDDDRHRAPPRERAVETEHGAPRIASRRPRASS